MQDFGLNLVRVSDRLFYLPNLTDYDWPCLGLLVGSRRTMMLDAGASERHVRLFFQKLTEAGLPLPDLCALTHWHWDHTYGLPFTGALSFANSDTNARLRAMQSWGWSEQEMRRRIESGEDLAFSYPYQTAEYPDRSQIRISTADVVYQDSLTVDLGGVTVQMQKLQNSHSPDCSVLYIPEERCLFLGDILYEDLQPQPPVYYRAPHAALSAAIAAYPFERAILGHQSLHSRAEVLDMLSAVTCCD